MKYIFKLFLLIFLLTTVVLPAYPKDYTLNEATKKIEGTFYDLEQTQKIDIDFTGYW